MQFSEFKNVRLSYLGNNKIFFGFTTLKGIVVLIVFTTI